MASINPRLLPLIETLIAVGADWLAVELIETLNQGRWPEESEETLAATRTQVREGGVPKRAAQPFHKIVAPQPILPDEQVRWAATFVAERLDAALGDLVGSLDNLDVIIGDTPEAALVDRARQTTILRLGGEDGLSVAAADIEAARSGIQGLRGALARWARDADGLPA